MKVEDEIDPADQLQAGLDLLRVTAASLTAASLLNKETRQAIVDCIGHSLETIEPVREFLESCRVRPV